MTLVSENAAHNSLQMSSSRDLTDVTLVCEGHDSPDNHNVKSPLIDWCCSKTLINLKCNVREVGCDDGDDES